VRRREKGEGHIASYTSTIPFRVKENTSGRGMEEKEEGKRGWVSAPCELGGGLMIEG
jgi:hypothetical protein